VNEKRNIKQKINLFIGSIGAFIGVAVFVAYARLYSHYPQFGRGSFRILNFYYFTLKLLDVSAFRQKQKRSLIPTLE